MSKNLQKKEEQWLDEFNHLFVKDNELYGNHLILKDFIRKIRQEAIESTKDGIAREIDERNNIYITNIETTGLNINEVKCYRDGYKDSLKFSENIAKNYKSNTN